MKFLPNYPFKTGEKMVLTIKVLGIYIGDQEIFIENITNYNGKILLVGRGHLSTTPFISSMYKVDDSEITYLLPENFIPIYYERWINEGKWHDNIKFNFFPEEQKVEYAQKVNNYDMKTLKYSGTLRNYFTLISCMRSIDYDYHISNKINIEIDYLFGTTVKKAKFKPSIKKIRYIGKDLEVIYLEEIKGIGMNFYISNDANRTPLRLIIPAFEVIGFKTISVYVELKEFKQGTIEILIDIPATNNSILTTNVSVSATNTFIPTNNTPVLTTND